jgi:hypothetical protein
MLSIVDTGGCMQYFLKSCFAIATTGFCSVGLMKDAMMLGSPTNKMQSYAISLPTMHWYTSQTGKTFCFDRGFCQLLDDGSFASHR